MRSQPMMNAALRTSVFASAQILQLDSDTWHSQLLDVFSRREQAFIEQTREQ